MDGRKDLQDGGMGWMSVVMDRHGPILIIVHHLPSVILASIMQRQALLLRR